MAEVPALKEHPPAVVVAALALGQNGLVQEHLRVDLQQLAGQGRWKSIVAPVKLVLEHADAERVQKGSLAIRALVKVEQARQRR